MKDLGRHLRKILRFEIGGYTLHSGNFVVKSGYFIGQIKKGHELRAQQREGLGEAG